MDWCAVEGRPVAAGSSIVCGGVSSSALNRLNELLDSLQLTLAQKLVQADRWARLYRDCIQRLVRMADHDPSLRSVASLAKQGSFEEVSGLLEHSLESVERSRAARAEYRFVGAQILSLQFREPDALPLYEKAFENAPDVFAYAFAFAGGLRQAQLGEKARHLYQHALSLVHEGDSSAQSAIALTLTSLGMLDRAGGRVRESERAYREALQIYRQLGEDGYSTDIAELLNHLGVLYYLNQRASDAELAYLEALAVYRRLAQANPAVHLPDVAGTLHNLSLLYRDGQRAPEAQWAARAALDVYRELVSQGIEAYLPDVANTLNGLGVLYHASRRFSEAEHAYREALAIYNRLMQSSSNADYRAELSGALNNLGVLFRDTQRMREASRALREAAQIRSGLASRKPRRYTPDLIQTLANLEKVYHAMGWAYEARQVSDRLEKLGIIP